MAFCPMEKYEGTHHKVDEMEKMFKATTRGVYIVKELTENTCECTRAQQVDLKISAVPLSVMDIVAKQHMSYFNELQEQVRSNKGPVRVSSQLTRSTHRSSAGTGRRSIESGWPLLLRS